MSKFIGRKFLVCLFILVLILANRFASLGISSAEMHQIVIMGLGYIFGEGSADVVKALNRS